MAWVGWQQLESAYDSGYGNMVGCAADGSTGHLQAPQRAQYAREQSSACRNQTIHRNRYKLS